MPYKIYWFVFFLRASISPWQVSLPALQAMLVQRRMVPQIFHEVGGNFAKSSTARCRCNRTPDATFTPAPLVSHEQDVELFTEPARLMLQAVQDSGGRFGFAGEQLLQSREIQGRGSRKALFLPFVCCDRLSAFVVAFATSVRLLHMYSSAQLRRASYLFNIRTVLILEVVARLDRVYGGSSASSLTTKFTDDFRQSRRALFHEHFAALHNKQPGNVKVWRCDC